LFVITRFWSEFLIASTVCMGAGVLIPVRFIRNGEVSHTKRSIIARCDCTRVNVKKNQPMTIHPVPSDEAQNASPIKKLILPVTKR